MKTSEVLKTSEVSKLLEVYGITNAKMELAQSADEAVEFAKQVGMPVALKVASAEILHKSDVGGVLLNLGDEAAIRIGYKEVLELARSAHPKAEIQGVHVQRMIPSGQEVIVGAVQDPQFGAQMMFGSGGTEVEGLKDIAFGLAPLTMLEAERMLESTWAGRKLKGFRNIPPADRDAVLDVLFRLAQLAAEHPEIAEIEINPLRVLPKRQGAVAVDVRVQIAE